MGIIQKIFGNYSQKEIKRIEPIKDKVLELESKYEKMSDDELRGMTALPSPDTGRYNPSSGKNKRNAYR